MNDLALKMTLTWPWPWHNLWVTLIWTWDDLDLKMTLTWSWPQNDLDYGMTLTLEWPWPWNDFALTWPWPWISPWHWPWNKPSNLNLYIEYYISRVEFQKKYDICLKSSKLLFICNTIYNDQWKLSETNQYKSVN